MSKYSKEKLQEAVINSKSFADVCRYLGAKDSTGSQSYLTAKVRAYNLDTSHFTGQGWRKGSTFKAEWANLDQYLVKGSKISSHTLKLRLIRSGLKNSICESCKRDEWLGEPIVLELDHEDSDHTNNELSNLQILCSNCHATFTRQRIKQRGSGEMVETH